MQEVAGVEGGGLEVVDVDGLAGLADEAGDVGLVEVDDELGGGHAALLCGGPWVAKVLEDVDIDAVDVGWGEWRIGGVGGLAEVVLGEDVGAEDGGVFG